MSAAQQPLLEQPVQHALAGLFTEQIMAPCPFPTARLIKTPIRVNSLAFGVFGVCSSNAADELEYIYGENYFERIKDAHILQRRPNR
jgi:hypothetical protein